MRLVLLNRYIVIHCNSIITRSSGSTGNNSLYTRDRCSKSTTRSLFHRFSHTQTNAPPTVIWYGPSLSVFSFMVITHKLFINRGINTKVYVGRPILIDLLHLFNSDNQVKWFVLVTKTRLHVR